MRAHDRERVQRDARGVSTGDALRGLHDGSRTGEREQTVLTPTLVLDPLRSVWGRIAFDPCAPPGKSLVDAEHEARLPLNGLAFRWIDRTYCNPPFVDLAPWLAPQIESGARVAWLVPVRPHRRWWRTWARTLDTIVFLNPFAFVGHTQTFPAPLCVGYRGHDAAQIVEAYRDLGEPL